MDVFGKGLNLEFLLKIKQLQVSDDNCTWCSYHTSGNCVGLMIPDTVSQVEREKFERMLDSLTALRHQEEAPAETVRTDDRTAETRGAESTSTKISKGLLVGKQIEFKVPITLI